MLRQKMLKKLSKTQIKPNNSRQCKVEKEFKGKWKNTHLGLLQAAILLEKMILDCRDQLIQRP